jgi:hypothetical protein
MKLYEVKAGGRPIKAYINVGGGTVSVGRSVGKKLYQPGLNLAYTPEALQIDSVMTRFAQKNTPIIHLVEVMILAKAYHLPEAPAVTPAAGEGWLFYDTSMHRVIALGFLLGIGVAFRFVTRPPAITKPSLLTLPPEEDAPARIAA